MEYKTGMYKVLNSTVHGNRDTVRLKLLLSIALAGIAFVFASLPELIYIGQNFGYAGITLPSASIYPTDIGKFRGIFGALPIWSYMVIMLILRFTVFSGIVMIIHALSMKIKNNAYAALAAAGILLLPLFLYLFGFNLFNAFSLLELVTVNGLIVAPGILKSAQAVVFIAACVTSMFYIIRRFGKA